mgnify:FL=1
MGVGVLLYKPHDSRNIMKSVVEVKHTKNHFDDACGYTSKFKTDSPQWRTAMKRGYWKCTVCNEPMPFRKQKVKQTIYWLGETNGM